MLPALHECTLARRSGCSASIVSGEVAVMQARHATYYLTVAERADPGVLEPHPSRLRYLEREHANLSSALEWAHTNAPELGLQLAAALRWFWFWKRSWQEGVRWLEMFLAAVHPSQVAARVAALLGLGAIKVEQGQGAVAAPLLEDAVQLARQNDDQALFLEGVYIAALNTLASGNVAAATAMLDEVFEHSRRANLQVFTGWAPSIPSLRTIHAQPSGS